MSEIATRLRDRRMNVVNETRALADAAAEENRQFTAEEQGTWDALNEELDKLDARIKSVLEAEKRAKDADAAMDAIVGGGKQGGGQQRGADAPPATPDEQALIDQFRKLANGEIRHIDVAMPTAIERRAFLGPVEQRAPILKANAPMPVSFIGQLYQYLVDTSSIRAANPTVYTTQSGETLTVPRSTAEGAATWFGEGAQITESNPTLSSVDLGSFKVGKTIYVSTELITDTGFDLLGFIAEHAGRNVGIAVDAAYVAGDGTGKPTGFLTTATTISMGTGTVTGFAAAPNSADPLFDAYHGVLPQYRSRGSWVMHDQTIKAARKIKDTTGQYLWQPGLVAGAPDTLLGRPVYPDPNMEQFGVTGRKVIAFGDFGGYWIRDVTPLRFDRSDDFRFDTDVVSFRVLYRTDGKQGDTQALRVLTTLT